MRQWNLTIVWQDMCLQVTHEAGTVDLKHGCGREKKRGKNAVPFLFHVNGYSWHFPAYRTTDPVCPQPG
jgi:hypothetical protein